MANQYHMDLEQFSLEQLRQIVESGDLLPSEKILEQETAERFAVLASVGIRNLKDLTSAPSSKTKIERFSQESGLPQDYLIVLRRRARIYTPRPKPLRTCLASTPSTSSACPPGASKIQSIFLSAPHPSKTGPR